MLFAVGLFAACDSEGGSDVIWDIAPVEFNIFITDSEGHDLLDSTFQNNLIKEITVSYQGETYPVTTEREYYEELYGDIQTRAYMPHFYGLMLHHSWNHKTSNYGDYELTFGEFDGVEISTGGKSPSTCLTVIRLHYLTKTTSSGSPTASRRKAPYSISTARN